MGGIVNRRIVGLVVLAGLTGGGVPAVAQAAPSVRAAPSVHTAVTAQATLPPDGDPSWTKVFEDGFNLPHVVSTDPVDGMSVYTVGGNPVWKNLGYKPIADGTWKPRPMNECASVDQAAGILTLKPFPKTDPADPKKTLWRCRITSTAQFGSGTYIFAARIKVHTSQGHLSSFWLNTAPGGGPTNEIDVIENSGRKSLAKGCQASATMPTNYGTQDGPYYGLNHTYYSAYTPANTGYKYCLSQAATTPLQNDGFHTFHAEWSPGQYIKFYTDGTLSATYGPQYAKDTPLNAILTNIDKQNASNPAQDFQVNWVKVWKKNPPPPPPPPAVCDNDCWRAQLGVESYNYILNSDMGDPRLARIIFDRKFYAAAYPDVRVWADNKVATQGGHFYDHVQWHWLNYGIPWGRQGSTTFDPIFYMNAQPDVSAAYGWNNYTGAIGHYISYGRFEGRRASAFLDPGFYRSRYGDLAGHVPYQLVDHFAVNGMSEGRQGSADFGPAYYLGTYADLRNAYGSNGYHAGMSHWISNGRAEGRLAVP